MKTLKSTDMFLLEEIVSLMSRDVSRSKFLRLSARDFHPSLISMFDARLSDLSE